MIIKIIRQLNIIFILYNKKEFSLEIFLNGISIILGIVYILYVEYPIFVGRIKGNKIAIISSFLSFSSSLSADLMLGKTRKIA